MPSGQLAASIGGYLDRVYRLRFSADSRLLAVAIGQHQEPAWPGEMRFRRVIIAVCSGVHGDSSPYYAKSSRRSIAATLSARMAWD